MQGLPIFFFLLIWGDRKAGKLKVGKCRYYELFFLFTIVEHFHGADVVRCYFLFNEFDVRRIGRPSSYFWNFNNYKLARLLTLLNIQKSDSGDTRKWWNEQKSSISVFYFFFNFDLEFVICLFFIKLQTKNKCQLIVTVNRYVQKYKAYAYLSTSARPCPPAT